MCELLVLQMAQANPADAFLGVHRVLPSALMSDRRCASVIWEMRAIIHPWERRRLGVTRLRRGAGAAAAERVHRGEPGCACPCCRRDREAAWRSGPPMAREGPGWVWGWVVAAGRSCSRTREDEDRVSPSSGLHHRVHALPGEVVAPLCVLRVGLARRMLVVAAGAPDVAEFR